MDRVKIYTDLTPRIDWNRDLAKHLLRRTLFGPTKDEIDTAETAGLDATLSTLFTKRSGLNEPLVVDLYDGQEDVPLGQSWIGKYNRKSFNRRNSLWSWWFEQMSSQDSSFEEKMILFLHNHIPIQGDVMRNANFYYDYLQILRRNCFGNLKTLVAEITISPGMLKYLDGQSNTAKAPNENFGRELLELFTIGKGPLIAEGNYTNYTEEDVQAASRVMTGWRVDNKDWSVSFDPTLHDVEEKKFTSSLGKGTITDQGDKEYLALLDLIFDQVETARHFVRKFYRFFVHSHIDSTIESKIIKPLATLLKDGGWEIQPVLEQLFKSNHFYDSKITGGLIKSPIDHVLGYFRGIEAQLDTPNVNYLGTYHAFQNLRVRSESCGWKIGHLPSVAGYEAYYLAPMYHRFFINSVTMAARQGSNEYITKGRSANLTEDGGYQYGVNYTNLLARWSPPYKPVDIAQDLVDLLLPRPLSFTILGALADVWASAKIYNDAAPDEDRLKAMLLKITQMPEFILC